MTPSNPARGPAYLRLLHVGQPLTNDDSKRRVPYSSPDSLNLIADVLGIDILLVSFEKKCQTHSSARKARHQAAIKVSAGKYSRSMASENKQYSFLITGASSGLGLAIGSEALSRGHKVVGTTRNVSNARKQNPQFEQNGGKWLELDVINEQAADIVSKAVVEHNIDVLVNNAGFGLYGVFEDMRSATRSIHNAMIAWARLMECVVVRKKYVINSRQTSLVRCVSHKRPYLTSVKIEEE
jgi:hypothetical protein